MSIFFHKLNQFNQHPEFREFREKNLRSMLTIATIIGVVFVLGFYSLDQIKGYENLSTLLRFRVLSSIIFLLNLAIALIHKNPRYLKFHVYLGFYLCAVYSSMQSVMTGGIQSPYWIGINLIMMVWFIFVPFSYQILIGNGILFITQYFFLVLFFENDYYSWGNIVELAFYLKGFLVIGAIISVVNNNQAVIIFEKQHNLEESEEKYKNLVEHANDGIVILQDGYVKFINEMMANILGWTPEEMLNTPFIRYISEEERPKVLDFYRRRQQGESLTSIYESVLVDKWGKHKPVEFNSSIINFRGETATQTYIRDISERKASELAIHKGEQRFSLFMDNLPAFAFIKGSDGKYIYANKSLKEFLGRQDVEGKSMWDIFPPEVAAILEKNEKDTLICCDINETEEYVKDKNGQERIIQTTRFRMDPGSDTSLIGGLAMDMTEHRKYEEELRKASERLALHIEHTPLGYIEWNDKMEVIEWNPAAEKIFGYTREEALHSHAYKLIVPVHEQPAISELWKLVLAKTGGSFNTNQNITKEGKSIFCEWFNSPLQDKNGKVIGLASLVQDITERKRLESELEKSHALLKKDYSLTLEQVQTYSEELQNKQNELLKLQKDNLQSQFEALKNQVNPHFLFNSLNVLISLISVEPELAEKFTGQLSKIYRYALEHRSEDLVSLTAEIDFLNSYMFLLNIRFTGKLKFNLNIPEDKMERKLLPLAMQLLIENAIKHNTFSVKSPLLIDIYIDEDDYLHVENNFQKREKHIITTGIGLQNITDRYSFFSDKELFFGIVGEKFVAKIPLL